MDPLHGGTGGGPFLGVPWLLGLFRFLLRQLDNIVLGQNSTVAIHCSITHHTIVIASLQLRVMYEREGVICEAQGPPEELILVHYPEYLTAPIRERQPISGLL